MTVIHKNEKNWLYRGVLTGGLALALASQAPAARLIFSANCDASQETIPLIEPAPNARAVAGIRISNTLDTLYLTIAATGLTSPVTKLHIHPGARGEANPFIVDLTPYKSSDSLPVAYPGLTPDLLKQMLQGRTYVNIHTEKNNANGEVRGQIELERNRLFTAVLNSANEFPVPDSLSNLQGLGVFELTDDDSAISVQVAFTENGDSVTAAHLHVGPPGTAGGFAVLLTPGITGSGINGRYPLTTLSNSFTTAAFLDSLKKGSIYINVHTKNFPAGALRGPLVAEKERVFVAQLNGQQENPAVTTPATGIGIFKLTADDSTLWARVAFKGLQGPFKAAHLHTGAVGVNGPVTLAFETSAKAGNSLSQNFNLFSLSETDRKAFVADLIKGNIYVNIHSDTLNGAYGSPGGEIRGQLWLPLRTGYIFAINGRQEIQGPPAKPTLIATGYGAGVVSIDRDSTNLRFLLLGNNLLDSLTGAHFHKVLDPTFPVVFNLATWNKATVKTEFYAWGNWTDRDGTPFTKDLAKDFHGGLLYTNLHTNKNAGGDIRGNMKDSSPYSTTSIFISPKGDAGFRARLHLENTGNGLRFQGKNGQPIALTVVDFQGKAKVKTTLRVGSNGFTSNFDLSQFKAGMYFALWKDGQVMRSAAFLRL